MNDDDEIPHKAYWEGFTSGYDDENADNPYREDQKEYQEWEDGYEQGKRDC